jgi:hypothetical protein
LALGLPLLPLSSSPLFSDLSYAVVFYFSFVHADGCWQSPTSDQQMGYLSRSRGSTT